MHTKSLFFIYAFGSFSFCIIFSLYFSLIIQADQLFSIKTTTMAVATKPIPQTFYISHGSPTLSIDDSLPARPFLQSFRQNVLPEKPKAILIISGHWETSEPAVNAVSGPSETIYDFYGFPDKMYRIKYPAPGSPDLANKVKQLLIGSGFGSVSVDRKRGLDHGAWVPLMLMYPEADIPVCQLSVQTHKDAAHHYRVGRALTPLKDDGVLIIGSGAATHNLRMLNRNGGDAVAPWASEFDNWIKEALVEGRYEDVNDYAEKAPHARVAHPRPDHFYPLHVAMGAAGDNTRGELIHHSCQPIALGTLISRELRNKKLEKPIVKYGHADLAKKGEDYYLIKPDCQRVPGDPSTSFSVFAIFDGHNGRSAAIFAEENLLNNVLSAIPQEVSRDEWLQALPRALVAGFVKTDIEFQQRGETSGTTVTFVVIDGCTVTVASVGDSRCILDTRGGVVSLLTVDHRLEENVEERERVTASGGEVGRLNVYGGNGVGPLRCWPGGLCLSRSIGDTDVGEFIVPIPHVKQVKLSNAGGRLIIASDGIWDTLSSDIAAQACRGLPAELAATMVVKEALRLKGLKDDTTCLVVDIIPFDPVLPPAPKKKQNLLQNLLICGNRSKNTSKGANKLSAIGVVEELFEEGSAMLAERLGKDSPLESNSGLFRCAICQVDQPPGEGLSVNSGQFFSPVSKPWEGPFLCTSCRRKKDAMEGKRPIEPAVSA